MKKNPFPWLPWWPEVDDRAWPILVVGLILLVILIYFAF